MNLQEYLTQDHKLCDSYFTKLENSIKKKEVKEIKDYLENFYKRTRRHFKIEEEILFPLFEEKTKANSGPTYIMRIEHQDITQLIEELKQLGNELNKKNLEIMENLLESLLIILQQHNLKEEQILYPMMERILENQDEIIEKIKTYSL